MVPVFGQGRALLVLKNDEITKENIYEICSFITGPCSCQIKSQNPGIDLFIPADWYSTEKYQSQEYPTPITNIPDDAKKVALKTNSSKATNSTPPSTAITKTSTNSINYNYLIIANIGFIIILLLTIFILKKKVN